MDSEAASMALQAFVDADFRQVSISDHGLLVRYDSGLIVLYCPIRCFRDRKVLFECLLPVAKEFDTGIYSWGKIRKIAVDDQDCSLRILFEDGAILSAFPVESGRVGTELCWVSRFKTTGTSGISYLVGTTKGLFRDGDAGFEFPRPPETAK